MGKLLVLYTLLTRRCSTSKLCVGENSVAVDYGALFLLRRILLTVYWQRGVLWCNVYYMHSEGICIITTETITLFVW